MSNLYLDENAVMRRGGGGSRWMNHLWWCAALCGMPNEDLRRTFR